MKNEEIYKVSDLYVVRVFETEKSYKSFNDLNYKVKNLVRNEEFYDWEMLSDIVKLDSVEFLTKEEIKVLESELNKRFALVRK